MDKEDITYVLYWKGRYWGESLILAMITSILNDQGVDALLIEHRKSRGLLDCPLYDVDNPPARYKKVNWWYDGRKSCGVPIMKQYMEYYGKIVGRELRITRDHVPVKFEPMAVPSVDVFMCTQVNPWGPYRNWPYFGELKALLDAEGISYVDMHEKKIWSMECLNYVRKCKLYLGLDTGVSHYVSKFANGKTLIIQGGFVTFEYWALPYRYDCIQVENVPCRPCFIRQSNIDDGEDCPMDHMCMRKITPEMVLREIKNRI